MFAALPAWAAPVNVLAFGDSLTAGYGLPAEDGFVPQLQAWLNDKGIEAVVINGGVSGDTTAGGLARIDWALTPDVDAMILALGGNDLLRGLPPEQARANLDAILSKADERGLPILIIPVEAPANYGPDYKARFDAIWQDLAASHGALLGPPFLGPITRIADRSRALAEYMQADGIHPNAKGVALIVQEVGPYVVRLIDRARTGTDTLPQGALSQ
ncbi:acyl-CoA thioesterase-1 [Albidovulum inexpectatum]|uniref:Acyl-CoA thioesterase-1 n=1 Tax=Albidovulum inexpectatum TaxID=196587 RepID=A0A2S5JL96_9RHOB|nr:arylesterase [Albidovulum inexpectatum]PPB82220.1 acyl-CoA thioesterase-1 [Albidovulum inexpectatum]